MEPTHRRIRRKISAKSGIVAGYIDKAQFVATHTRRVMIYLNRTQGTRPVKVDGRPFSKRFVCNTILWNASDCDHIIAVTLHR
jgi:hypothetical protein